MKRCACILAVLIAVSACTAMRPVPAPSGDWQERQDRLLGLSSWRFRGRIAVRYESRGENGNLSWQQEGEQSTIQLSGPFGAGAYQILWEPGSVTVIDGAGEQQLSYSGPDAAEQFLYDQLGWWFPASSTRYWLLGTLDPRYQGHEHFDADGRLSGLEQNGWTVSYQRFVEAGDFLLPGKMAMEKANARLRLVIDSWDL
jgi:outer membrane lipoprotein LolB